MKVQSRDLERVVYIDILALLLSELFAVNLSPKTASMTQANLDKSHAVHSGNHAAILRTALGTIANRKLSLA